MEDNSEPPSFGAYKKLTQKIEECFFPRIIVVASDKAKLLCNVNYLTPAEFFSPFVRDLDWSKESRPGYNMQQEFQGEPIPNFVIEYKKIELIDVEEWQPMTEASLQHTFTDVLERNKPKISEIMKLTPFEVTSRPLSMLKTYGWEEACNFTSEYLKTMAKEYEFSNFNECQAVLYVLSSEDRQFANTIMELDRKHYDTLNKVFGEAPQDPKLIRLVVVLKPRDTKEDKEDLESRISNELKKVYSSALTGTVAINSKPDATVPDSNLWKDEYCYKKRKLTTYHLGGENTVDSNKKGYPRGFRIDTSDIKFMRSTFHSMFVRSLSDKFKKLIMNLFENAANLKKTVNKGFLGISMFKKEERPSFHLQGELQGKYIFTPVEKAVKKYADHLLIFGMHETAKTEYLYVLENLSKKSPETSNSINEMVTYLGLMTPNPANPGYPKEKMKYIHKKIMDLVVKSLNHSFRYARIAVVLNLINHIYFDGNEVPPTESTRHILLGYSKFSVKQNHLMLDFLNPFLLQQYTRYLLLSKIRYMRTFFSQSIEASALYNKKLDLKTYAIPGYIIAGKFYLERKLENWGSIYELVYYNLAILVNELCPNDRLEVESFITTLNNMNFLKNQEPSEMVKKATSGLKSKFKKALKQSQDDSQQTDLLASTTTDDPLTASMTGTITSSMYLTQSIRPPARNEISYPELETIAQTKLKMLSVRGFSIITPSEIPEKIQVEEDFDSIPEEGSGISYNSMMTAFMSSGTNLVSPIPQTKMTSGEAFFKVEKEQALKKHYELFDNILKSKFPQACQDSLKFGLTFSKISSFGEKMKSLMMRGREVYKGEKVIFEFKIKNEFWNLVLNDFEKLKLNFYHIPDPLPNFYSYKPENLIPCPSEQIFQYQVFPVPIKKGETKLLRVEVVFLQSGDFKLESIEMPFMGIVPFIYKLPALTGKYNDLRVSSVDTGILEMTVQRFKRDIHFGEIMQSSLRFRNPTSTRIEEIYLISSDPLYTGFGFKPLKGLEGGESHSIDLFIRGIESKLNHLAFIVVYKTNGVWKYCIYSYELMVHKSFSTKYHSEDIGDGRRLVCIDVINGRDSHVKPEDLEVCSLRLNSNTWRIVKDSQKLISDSKMVMIYFKVEPRPDVKPETQYLARAHREVSQVDVDFPLFRERH